MAEEKRELVFRAAHLDQQIAKLRLKIIGLARLIDDKPDEDSEMGEFLEKIKDVGLTKAIREVLMVSGEGMTATGIREALHRMGINLSRYRNIQATINTILKRLTESGEVDIGIPHEKGAPIKGAKKRYIWSPLHPAHLIVRAAQSIGRPQRQRTSKKVTRMKKGKVL